MSEQTVVLGWNGLDYDLVEGFGLSESFGPYYYSDCSSDSPSV